MVERRARFLTFSAVLVLALSAVPLLAQNAGSPGIQLPSPAGDQATTAELMEMQAQAPPRRERPDHELEYPDRSGLPQNPNAMPCRASPGALSGKAGERSGRRRSSTLPAPHSTERR